MNNFFNRIYRRIFYNKYDVIIQELRELRDRVDYIQHRTLNYYTNRWNAVDKIADYLVGAEIDGDYMEFGVYQGTTFSYAYKKMSPLFKQMRFFAFDSFCGLPDINGVDDVNGYTSSFYKGQYAICEDKFLDNLNNDQVDLSRVLTVKGWFSDTLKINTSMKFNIEKIAFAWIDCDLYESTLPVLDFITDKIVTGSVIVFDDWRCYRNLPCFGEQKACAEWLEKNPDIILNELISFGFHGIAFTVERK